MLRCLGRATFSQYNQPKARGTAITPTTMAGQRRLVKWLISNPASSPKNHVNAAPMRLLRFIGYLLLEDSPIILSLATKKEQNQCTGRLDS
jgi:hypothetical protein